MNKKIYFVTYGGGHVNIIISLYHEARKRGYDCTILGLTTATKKLRLAQVPFRSYLHYLGRIKGIDSEMAVNLGKELVRNHHCPGTGISEDESIAYLGLSMYDLVMDLGIKKAREKLEREGREAFLPVSVQEEILKLEKPDYVVTTNSPRSERAAVLAAKRLGIPTLSVADGLGVNEHYVLESTVVACMNSIAMENLVKAGVKRETIVITGQPAFDELVHFARNNILRPAGQRKRLLWATQPVTRVRKIWNRLEDILSARKDFQIVIKPHPNELNGFYQKLLSDVCYPEKVTVAEPASDIRDHIVKTDFVLTGFSTCALEAAIIGKPVVITDSSTNRYARELVVSGAGIGAGSVTNIPLIINQLANNDDYYRKMLDSTKKFRTDGKASSRVIDILSTL